MGDLKRERYRATARDTGKEMERSKGEERQSDRGTERMTDINRECLRVCKPTAEGLMMPGHPRSVFTKQPTAGFTIAGCLCHAGGHDIYSTMQLQGRSC